MHLLPLVLLLHAADDVRRLQPTEIQGKAPVPQVLFVSARNAPRFNDGLISELAPRAPEPVPAAPIDRDTWAALTAPALTTP